MTCKNLIGIIDTLSYIENKSSKCKYDYHSGGNSGHQIDTLTALNIFIFYNKSYHMTIRQSFTKHNNTPVKISILFNLFKKLFSDNYQNGIHSKIQYPAFSSFGIYFGPLPFFNTSSSIFHR